MFFYFYGVIGVTLIGDALDDLPSPPMYQFDSFRNAVIALFQLTVGEGWHEVMYSAAEAQNNLFVSIYFVSFVFIITLIFTNLFVGLVISLVDDMETQNAATSTAHSVHSDHGMPTNHNVHQRTRSKRTLNTPLTASRHRLQEIREINKQSSCRGTD